MKLTLTEVAGIPSFCSSGVFSLAYFPFQASGHLLTALVSNWREVDELRFPSHPRQMQLKAFFLCFSFYFSFFYIYLNSHNTPVLLVGYQGDAADACTEGLANCKVSVHVWIRMEFKSPNFGKHLSCFLWVSVIQVYI